MINTSTEQSMAVRMDVTTPGEDQSPLLLIATELVTSSWLA